MLNIGIDAVKIDRFKNWDKYPKSKLLRLFNNIEIDYCQNYPEKLASKFASRFAFKEAIFKALEPFLVKKLPFLTICKLTWVENDKNGLPKVKYDPKLESYLSQKLNFSVSITYTHDTVIAAVIAYNSDKFN